MINATRYALLILTFLTKLTLATDFSPEEVKSWQRQASSVNIIRDEYGVAHVYGKTDADAVFGDRKSVV